MMKNTQRDEIENILINNFKGLIRPLSFDDIEIINKFKDGSFGFSFLGIMLYANGQNQRGESSKYPKGLIYYDGENIFGIGFFKKTSLEKDGHLHIIAPRGSGWFNAVNDFIKKIRQISEIPKTSIYIRHLSEEYYKRLISNGYKPITTDPWDPTAHSEDETYCNRLIDLNDIITYDKRGNLIVKILEGEENRDFRRKAKMAYNRFGNFLERNNISFNIEQYYYHEHGEDAKNIVVEHFKTLKNKVGSSSEDYFNLIYFLPPDHRESIFFAYIGYIFDKNGKIPIMLFIGEKISSNTVAMYATFASRNNGRVYQEYDSTGFSAISQYCYLRVFNILKKIGISHVDLGGSEVEDLNNFKKQLRAKELKTYWVVSSY